MFYSAYKKITKEILKPRNSTLRLPPDAELNAARYLIRADRIYSQSLTTISQIATYTILQQFKLLLAKKIIPKKLPI